MCPLLTQTLAVANLTTTLLIHRRKLRYLEAKQLNPRRQLDLRLPSQPSYLHLKSKASAPSSVPSSSLTVN